MSDEKRNEKLKVINIILALTLLECIWSILRWISKAAQQMKSRSDDWRER